jgi:L-ascorbate metabolism protein UlaG (beta-lactamase superfamily)
MDGYKICHLGDLGHPLTEELIEEIGEIDVLLIPVGGNFTITGKEAAVVCKTIKSNIVIPMHYKTQYINFPISGAEDFITEMAKGKKLNSNTLNINDKLSAINEVLILDITN